MGHLTILLEIAGGAVVAYGVWLIWEPAALIVAGTLMIALAQGVED